MSTLRKLTIHGSEPAPGNVELKIYYDGSSLVVGDGDDMRVMNVFIDCLFYYLFTAIVPIERETKGNLTVYYYLRPDGARCDLAYIKITPPLPDSPLDKPQNPA